MSKQNAEDTLRCTCCLNTSFHKSNGFTDFENCPKSRNTFLRSYQALKILILKIAYLINKFCFVALYFKGILYTCNLNVTCVLVISIKYHFSTASNQVRSCLLLKVPSVWTSVIINILRRLCRSRNCSGKLTFCCSEFRSSILVTNDFLKPGRFHAICVTEVYKVGTRTQVFRGCKTWVFLTFGICQTCIFQCNFYAYS